MPDANGGRTCRRQLLRGVVCAAVLAVGGLTASPGVSPAEAADTLRGTDIEVPAPLPAPIRGDSDAVPAPPAGGGGEASPATVPLAGPEGSPAPGGTEVTPSSPSSGAAADDSGGGAGARGRTRPRGRTGTAPAIGAPAPAAPASAVVHDDDGGDATVERLREAGVPAARQFGLPLLLGAIVLAFLFVQGRVDRRDAKLMAAPITVADDLLPFA